MGGLAGLGGKALYARLAQAFAADGLHEARYLCQPPLVAGIDNSHGQRIVGPGPRS